jgi:hypothetical protein
VSIATGLGLGLTYSQFSGVGGAPYDGVLIPNQPVSWAGLEGATATFTVGATSGDASALTYEWQEFTGGSWSPTAESGFATPTLTVSPVVLADNGRQFRVNVCNDFNCQFSVVVTLTITGAKFFITDEAGNRQITETTLANIMDEQSV